MEKIKNGKYTYHLNEDGRVTKTTGEEVHGNLKSFLLSKLKVEKLKKHSEQQEKTIEYWKSCVILSSTELEIEKHFNEIDKIRNGK